MAGVESPKGVRVRYLFWILRIEKDLHLGPRWGIFTKKSRFLALRAYRVDARTNASAVGMS